MMGLHWTDFDKSIASRLIVHGEDHNGPVSLVCYRKSGDTIGVPLQWAKRNLDEPIEDSLGESIDIGSPIVTFRDGQEEAVNEIHKSLLELHGGIVELHTGFGKTLVSLCLAARLGVKTLVICHKEDLLHQWADSCKKFFGIEAGWIQGDRLDYSKPVVVATVQTLHSRKDSFPKDFFNQFGFTIFDEGHRFSCATFTAVACMIPSRYKLGMSATFRRNDGLDDAWKHFIGDIIYRNKKKAMGGSYYQPITSSYGLTDAKFKMRGSGKLNHSRYITEITKIPERNNRIAATVDSLVKAGRKVLVLSDRVEHLQELQRLIETPSGMYVGSIDGKKVQAGILKENAKCRVILGTSGKIAEGSDIPDLDTLVICTPKTDVEQLVGRITREHPNKQEPYIVDPVLDTGYNRALARKRENFYHKLGFKKRTTL